MKTRHSPAEASAPVELPSAATLPSSFPEESMPVGATMGIPVRKVTRAELLDLYGLEDCDEQEENGK